MRPINLPEPCVGAECHVGNGELGTGPFHTIHFIYYLAFHFIYLTAS